MAVSGYLSAELAATCNALGFYDGQKYHLEPHCKETIRDLIRYLRRDEGGSHEIRRYLGNAKLLQTDLLPMVQCHHQDVQLFDIALRLIVNLTNPALLVYNEVIPTDKFEHNYYLEIVSHLQLYKEAFNDHRSWAPFTERLSVLLGKPVEDRSEDDQRTIERILILIRNVLHVPSSADQDQRPDNDASIHDQVLWGLHQSGMIDLLLYISSSEQEKMFFMHLLEILCLMLREQPPELLAKTASHRSVEEKNKDDEELLRIRHAELQAKMKKHKKYFGTRHSNFGGTFVIKNLKSTSDNNDLIYHKPVHDSKYISLDTEKKPVKLPKNRQPLKCESVERKSALSVRLILKQVCVEFLNAAYNPMMLHVRECFHRGRAQENDESYYFTAMRFFMEFNRHYNFQVKYVSETLSVQTFQFIQKYLEQWHEMMVTDKKKLPLWSYRSHLALRAYKELLHNLAFMDRSADESVRESSKVIKSNIFYVVEYREMLLTLVNMYKREKYSRKYLVDLVETIHIFTKLLCDFGKDKKMVIQKTAARRKKKSKNKSNSNTKQDLASAETIWNLACDDVAMALSSPVECDVVPFDATLELDMDQQKLEAIKKIQTHLKNGDYKLAVAMLRASREVWPENDTFGTATADATEELDILKDIFLADLGTGPVAPFVEKANGSDAEGSEEEGNYSLVVEKNFETIDFIKRFASPKVVSICNSLLATYDTNSETTNHCVVKLLHRIAWECKLPAMLFQASLFIKFRNILANYDPKHKELAKLAVYTTRKFTEVAETNKTVFVELLFPKHVKDACEIVDGYGTYQDSKNKRIAWEEHEEEELKRLDEEYRATNVTEDKVDWILDNLINKERSRRGVVQKMKELGLEVPNKTKTPKSAWEEEQIEELKRLYEECDKDMPEKLIVSFIHEKMSSNNPDLNHSILSIKKKMYELNLLQKPVKKLKTWTEDQDEDLTELFNAHKHDDDPMRPIMAVLGNLRSRQNVISALLRLGLISDKDEVRKKSKSRKTKRGDSDDEDSDDESDDEEETVRPPVEDERPPPVGRSAAALLCELSRSQYILGGLKWLVTALNDNLEDLDADVFDADVPLLPLSQEAVLSMENDALKDFLHAVGFKKPVQHQEVYWRVSSTWKETDFRTRIDLFDFIVENHDRSLGELANDFNQKLSAAVGIEVDVLRTDSSSQDVDLPDSRSSARMPKSTKPPKDGPKKVKPKKKSNLDRLQNFLKENANDGSDSDAESVRNVDASIRSDSEEENTRSSGITDRPTNSRLGAISPSRNSEDEDDPGAGKPESASQNSVRIEYNSNNELCIVSSKRKLSGSDDSSSDAPRHKNRRSLLDSDDENDTHSVSSRKQNGNAPSSKKKRKIIDSDDETDGQLILSQAPKIQRNGGIESDDEMASSSSSSNPGFSAGRKKSGVIDSDDDASQAAAASKSSGFSASRKKSGVIDSDDDASQPTAASKSSVVLSPARRYMPKKKSKLIDSDDDDVDSQQTVASKMSGVVDSEEETDQSKTGKSKASNMDSQTSVETGVSSEQAESGRKKSKVVDSDDDKDSQISEGSNLSSSQPKISKNAKTESLCDMQDSQGSAAHNPSRSAKDTAKALDSDDEIDSPVPAARTPSRSAKKKSKAVQGPATPGRRPAKKKSNALDSDDEIDGPVPKARTPARSAKKKSKAGQGPATPARRPAKKKSSALDSDDEMDGPVPEAHTPARSTKKKSKALDDGQGPATPARSTKKKFKALDSDEDMDVQNVNDERASPVATKKRKLPPDTDDELVSITNINLDSQSSAGGIRAKKKKTPSAALESEDEEDKTASIGAPSNSSRNHILDSSDEE